MRIVHWSGIVSSLKTLRALGFERLSLTIEEVEMASVMAEIKRMIEDSSMDEFLAGREEVTFDSEGVRVLIGETWSVTRK